MYIYSVVQNELIIKGRIAHDYKLAKKPQISVCKIFATVCVKSRILNTDEMFSTKIVGCILFQLFKSIKQR